MRQRKHNREFDIEPLKIFDELCHDLFLDAITAAKEEFPVVFFFVSGKIAW
jgi:hypothetical protein